MALSFNLARLERPVVPFLGIAVLAFAATGLEPSGTNWSLVVTAAVGVVVLAAIALALPWASLPAATMLVLPISMDAAIALLRQAQGGSTSGYGPLVILPVVWVGLTQGRRAVAAMSCCTALVFALPVVLIGAPLYPEGGWRSVILWAVVSAVIGIGVNRAVAYHRRQTDATRDRAQGLGQLVETQTAIASAHTGVAGLMAVATEGALTLTEAEAAVIHLLEDDEVVIAAAAGSALPFLGLRSKAEGSLAGECFRTRQVIVCADSEADTRADHASCRRIGARSLILVPLLERSEVRGVLLVWSSTPRDFLGYESQLLELLASIVVGALARAELVEKLTSQAVTDELTGLSNRRAWYHELDQALARGRRTGHALSVLVLDLDGFKVVNDREGHNAGDKLLKTITSLWAGVLRTTDVLGRIGGDEFGVILELTDGTAALEVIARLDEAIAGSHRASTGLAVWDGNEDAAGLIARADTDMYRHKRADVAIAR